MERRFPEANQGAEQQYQNFVEAEDGGCGGGETQGQEKPIFFLWENEPRDRCKDDGQNGGAYSVENAR